MNYTEALNYIHSIPKFVRPLGNAQLAELLELLGSPQNKLKFIHIAGTNGKGSSAAIIAEALKISGYKTGLYTSPFIEVFNERIRINGSNIPNNDLIKYTERVKETAQTNNIKISEFAFITAVAFLYFYDLQCDFVVLETGMGGRLDATNIIPCPIAAVLMSISLDHTQYLGDTIEEITAEKCGIIKESGTVITYPNDNVMDIIELFAQKNNAVLIKTQKALPTDTGFIYKGVEYPLSLKGSYQPQNAAVALEVLFALSKKDIKISDTSVRKALIQVQWPARFEFLRDNLIIDGCHNIDGIKALKSSLKSLGKRIILVMAMMQDKNYSECVKELSPISDIFIATEINMPRCLKSDVLLECAKQSASCSFYSISNPSDAVNKALSLADDNSAVCVCGSLYLAGEIRKQFHNLQNNASE